MDAGVVVLVVEVATIGFNWCHDGGRFCHLLPVVMISHAVARV